MGHLINQGEDVDGDYFTTDGWRKCSGPSLRGHIANTHLRPTTMASIGVPLFDIEVAQRRGFGLGWVVSKAIDRLALPDEATQEQGIISPRYYRIALIKTVRLIDERGLAIVPWDVMDRLFPGASNISFDSRFDTNDTSFAAWQTQEGAFELGGESLGITDTNGLYDAFTQRLAEMPLPADHIVKVNVTV